MFELAQMPLFFQSLVLADVVNPEGICVRKLLLGFPFTYLVFCLVNHLCLMLPITVAVFGGVVIIMIIILLYVSFVN